MYWAVQGMAAELACGMLVMQAIRNESRSISMLLVGSQAKFTKKATGRIEFECLDGAVAKRGVAQSLSQSEGVQFDLTVIGRDARRDIVSEFVFNWSVRTRSVQ